MNAAFPPSPQHAAQSVADVGRDRFGFSLLLAIALHAAVILGVSFEQHARHASATKLDITLAQYRSERAPDRADYLAQENQEGSGTLQEKAELTTTERADFHDTTIREVSPQREQAASLPTDLRQLLVTTTAQSRSAAVQRTDVPAKQQQAHQGDVTVEQRRAEIASLEAKFDIQRQAYAARPRIRRLTSVATKRSEDALYLHNWRTRIEQVGNANYPAQARERQLFGELRLLVGLLPDGSVDSVRILDSSGHRILDEAAVRIVHMAAPYAPFPSDMGRKVDRLEIIRTWRFHQDRLSSES